MRHCQQSRTLDILILLYIPCLNTAINHKNKIAIKQLEVVRTDRACERSRHVPGIFVVPAALKYQAAVHQAHRRLRDTGLPSRQETQFSPAASHKSVIHFSLFTSFRFSYIPEALKTAGNLLTEPQFHPIIFRDSLKPLEEKDTHTQIRPQDISKPLDCTFLPAPHKSKVPSLPCRQDNVINKPQYQWWN